MITVYSQSFMCLPGGVVPKEHELIDHMVNQPSPRWAIDNSMNKQYYIHRRIDTNAQIVAYEFMVFLSNSKATFWKLKHGCK